LSGYVEDLAVSVSDEVYLVGSFSQDASGSTTLNYVAKWNGSAFVPLGDGFYDFGYRIFVSPSGEIWAAGTMSDDEGASIQTRLFTWNGTTWGIAEVDVGTAATRGMDFMERADGQDIVLITNVANTITIQGVTTNVANNGSAPVFPTIEIKRSGGTSATLELIRNEESGLELLFNLPILDGETVTINLEDKTVTSDYRGDLIDKMLPNSDFLDWSLLPGTNDIYTYISTAGAPTITANMMWRDCYWSVDDS
jgi:hypothetical protein